jgi:hypothetical protein
MVITRNALALSLLLVSSVAFAFPANVTLTAPAGAGEFGYALAQGDMNGDTFPDLLVGAPGNPEGSLYIYAGGEDGLSATPFWSMTLDISTGSGLGKALAVADVNDDDFPDILVLVDNGAPDGPFPFALHGTGTAEGPEKILNSRPASTAVASVRSLTADFDSDKFLDGAVGDPEAGSVEVRYTDSPFVNDPPVWLGMEIDVSPEVSAGTVIGTIEAFDPEGEPLTFTKTDGSLTGFVSLDASSGELTVVAPSLLPIPDEGESLELTMPVLVSDGEKITINEVAFEILHKKSDEGVFVGQCFIGALGF